LWSSKESYPGERRVALVPAVIPTLAKAGMEVVVSPGGRRGGYSDSVYVEKAGKILPIARSVSAADIIVQCFVTAPMT